MIPGEVFPGQADQLRKVQILRSATAYSIFLAFR